MFCISILIA